MLKDLKANNKSHWHNDPSIRTAKDTLVKIVHGIVTEKELYAWGVSGVAIARARNTWAADTEEFEAFEEMCHDEGEDGDIGDTTVDDFASVHITGGWRSGAMSAPLR